MLKTLWPSWFSICICPFLQIIPFLSHCCTRSIWENRKQFGSLYTNIQHFWSWREVVCMWYWWRYAKDSLCSCEQMFLNQPIFYWEILTLALSRIAPRISSVFSKRCTAKNSSGRSGDGGQWGSSPDSGVLIQVGTRKIPSPCSTQQGYFLHILPFSS